MKHLPPHLLPKVRSNSIMSAGAEMPCTIRVSSLYPGHRCSDEATVVMCHLPVDGKCFKSKVTDTAIAAGCMNCHAILDGVDHKRAFYIKEKYPTAFMERLLRASTETITRLIMMGVIVIPDAQIIGSIGFRRTEEFGQ